MRNKVKVASGCVVICGILGIIAALFLSGCTAVDTKVIRITEYAAESPLMSSATVGGCSIETSDEPPAVSVEYEGDKCNMSYGE